jgi:hypothetical protein
LPTGLTTALKTIETTKRPARRRILASPGGRALRNMRISRGDAWQEYSQTLRAGVADMPVYIVAKNDVPCHATFNEQEARQLYDSMLQSGRYRRVSAAVLFAYWEPHRWPQSMAQSTPW